MAYTLDKLLADPKYITLELDKIELSEDQADVRLVIKAAAGDLELIRGAEELVKEKLKERDVYFEYRITGGSVNEETVLMVLEELRRKGYPTPSLFKGAEYTFEDNTRIKVKLASKCLNTIVKAGIPDAFSLKFKEIFDISAAMELSEPDDSITLSTGDVKLDAFPDAKTTKVLTATDLKYKTKRLELENNEYEVLFGSKVKLNNLVDIRSILEVKGNFVIAGDVVEAVVDKKRNSSVVYTILITDYDSAITIDVYDREGYYKNLEKVKVGMTIAVYGEVRHDERKDCFVMKPHDIIRLFRKKPSDDEPEKRIELHLHTNMSQMDAIPSAEAAVMRAASLGHKAIAITDHGGVQAFPDARNALKAARALVPDFKILYGCELYYVDDSANIVFGTGDYTTESEIVCFDLETTGFNCERDRIIEIGACVIRNGQLAETFETFVDPCCPIPERITSLTGISDGMVKGAPKEKEAVEAFIKFAGDRPLCAHNASFDMSFLDYACKRMKNDYTKGVFYVDSMALAQSLLPELAHHKLDTLTKHFKLQSFNHHRGSDDAMALGRIYIKLMELLEKTGITVLSESNGKLGGRNIIHARMNHMIVLVKDQVGLKNLYTLVSKSNVDYFHGKPRVPLSLLLKHREGLIIGSACEAGEVYRAVMENKPQEYLDKICEKYDYFEIQPRCNNMFLVREGNLKDEAEVLEVNKRIVKLAERLGKPCVATCDVHFLDAKDGIYRKIILNGMKYSDFDEQAPLVYRNTKEMLEEFSYLGTEKAREVVITNPALIAEQIDPEIKPIPGGTFNPSIPGSEDQITAKAMDTIRKLYGDNPDSYVMERAKKELDSICGNKYAVLYLIAQKLVEKSESDGYHVGSRGSVGSSYVAFLLGISEVNPLPVHYLCPNCKHFEFTDSADDGFDLPNTPCPECGSIMHGDGHNIPFETFLGFHGEKCPDIDLNFSSEYQSNIFKYTEELFGSEYVFKAGTVMALQDNTALGYVKNYKETLGLQLTRAEERWLALGCTGVKKSTGQHPGGMVVIPNGRDINDFTPVQRPADKTEADFITTHFDFNSLHDTLLKLDELGHEIPTTYRYLELFSGINIADVPTSDKEVMKLFTSVSPLGVSESDIGSSTGTLGIPEMGTGNSRSILMDAKPQGMAGLVQVSGLSHGTGVWEGNAQELIKSGTCTISEVIGTRDGIMTTLISYGLANEDAFKIMEFVRKNKKSLPLPEEFAEKMREHKVPEWYIDSCRKIQYMFPKAHAVAYVTSAIKLAWFKLYKPLVFYAAYFTVRGLRCSPEFALGSLQKVRTRMKEVEKTLKDFGNHTKKDEEEMVTLQMLQEMKCRNLEILPVNLVQSHWKRFEICDGKLRLPFSALPGVGEGAAKALYDAYNAGEITAAEDLLDYPGVSKALLETLNSMDALGDLPMYRQVSLFD